MPIRISLAFVGRAQMHEVSVFPRSRTKCFSAAWMYRDRVARGLKTQWLRCMRPRRFREKVLRLDQLHVIQESLHGYFRCAFGILHRDSTESELAHLP